MPSDSKQDKVVADFVDGVRNEDHYRCVEQWLKNDSDHLRAFVAQLRIEQDLHQLCLDDDVSRFLCTPLVDDRRSFKKSPITWLATIAASILLAVASYFVLRGDNNPGTPNPPLQASANRLLPATEPGGPRINAAILADANSSVGTVWNVENCVWTKGQTPLERGADLAAGSRLSVEQGNLSIVFGSGARVTLAGPCDLILKDSRSCLLRLGNLAASIPPSAIGFSVTTPSSVTIDLGTEFGVSVDERGSSEVHVFDGEVATHSIDRNGVPTGEVVRLTSSEAKHFEIGGTTLREFEANEARFVHAPHPSIPPNDLPTLPIADNLALWLAADKQVSLDETGHVAAWEDLLIGDNQVHDDALQPTLDFRPSWSPHALNGKPGVCFEGNGTFLLTTPMETTNEQTLFFVVSVDRSKRQIMQLINYNGPPERHVVYRKELPESGVLHLQAYLNHRQPPTSVSFVGFVFTGHDKEDPMTVFSTARCDSITPLGCDQPVVVAYRYSLKNQQATLTLNGQLEQSVVADAPIAILSRKVLGRHPSEVHYQTFSGVLAEVLIYNSALSDMQMQSISKFLANQYSIDVD
ncbi:FecR family protein [Aeoliella mucimassa]|uniref:FecR protein n=1 Tax=Aeoliella mucimassa TaxID=2527972 RepID=A0A518APM4_9BACT|nr:FecR domain-containing protein [Aeoliella mucimassa]QDU56680.1 FecR protein [Aeoliella mucimassa]